MNIMICGASGLVGSALVDRLKHHHELILVGRHPEQLKKRFSDVTKHMSWDDLSETLIAEQQLIINLAGENIGNRRWSRKQKRQIVDSRVNSTTKIASYCCKLGKNSPRIINASAISAAIKPVITGKNQQTTTADALASDSDFLDEVVAQWESALLPAAQAGVSIVALRFSVILSNQGGALAKLLPSFKLGLGTTLGDGQQAFSWVTLNDAIEATIFFIKNPEIEGTFNIVADEVVTQKRFATTLASVLARPLFLCLPKSMVRILFGEMGDALLLKGIDASNKKLTALGFQFQQPSLREGLEHCLRK